MDLSGSVSAASRRMVVAVGLVALLGASLNVSVLAQEAPAQDPAPQAAAPAQADPLKFSRSGHVIILYQIKLASVADFELAWRTIKGELVKMGDPALAAFAQSIKILRVETPPGVGPAIFLFDLGSVSNTYSYNPVTLLYDTLKADEAKPGIGLSYDQATEIYDKIKDAYEAITPWFLSSVG